jgi:hypothetical protein
MSRRLLVGAVGAAAVAVLIGASMSVASTSSETAPYRKPACLVASSERCVVSWSRSGQVVRAQMNRGAPVEFEFGGVDDLIFAGNFLCGRSETLAAYRPTTGVVHFLDGWPDGGVETVWADGVGEQGLPAKAFRLGDFNGDGCADLGVVGADGVTWHVPAVQTGRLFRYEVKL